MKLSIPPQTASRRRLTTLAVVLAASFAWAPSSGARAEDSAATSAPDTVEIKAAMLGMKPVTNYVPMTGDMDHDFALMMITHHEAGISMSSAEEGYGEHQPLQDLAVVDLFSQQKENREMRDYLKHNSSTKASNEGQTGDKAVMNVMNKMTQSLDHIKLTGNADHDFIVMMVPHHEAAISMAQTELKYGSNPGVKKIAEGIITGQTKDVENMKTWYKDWFGNTYPM